MLTHKKHKASGKIWIEYQGKPILGRGGAEILQEIETQQSLSKAAEKLGMSYRYVWNYIQKIHKALGETVVETHKGGKSGGGGAKLTETGKSLLEEYTRLESYLSEFLASTKTMGGERLENKRKKSSQRKSSGSRKRHYYGEG
jgi:molybdate transport system regulatory protein